MANAMKGPIDIPAMAPPDKPVPEELACLVSVLSVVALEIACVDELVGKMEEKDEKEEEEEKEEKEEELAEVLEDDDGSKTACITLQRTLVVL